MRCPYCGEDIPDGAEDRLTVSGTGTVTAKPDEAQLEVSVTTVEPTPEEAMSSNNAGVRKVIEALEGAGLDRDSMSTARVDLSAKSREPGKSGGARYVVGYTASNSIPVKAKDLDRVGKVKGAAMGAGATSIDSFGFYASEVEKIQLEALEEAVENARLKGETYASSAGRTLGKALTIEETGRESHRSYALEPETLASALPPDEVPLIPGEDTCTSGVRIVYELL